jgi:hypothetical protein
MAQVGLRSRLTIWLGSGFAVFAGTFQGRPLKGPLMNSVPTRLVWLQLFTGRWHLAVSPVMRLLSSEEIMMKLPLYALATLSIATVPAVSFAQPGDALTRAEVIAELIQVENAGFHPASVDYVEYPGNLQAAEACVAAKYAGTPGHQKSTVYLISATAGRRGPCGR